MSSLKARRTERARGRRREEEEGNKSSGNTEKRKEKARKGDRCSFNHEDEKNGGMK